MLVHGLLLLSLVPERAAEEFQPPPSRQELPYTVHLPSGYEGSTEAWPVILYLHGRSLSGSDLTKLRRYGPPKLVGQRPDFPFILVAPQCPKGERWTDTTAVVEVLDEVMAKFRVDPKRVYALGFSMGGRGVLRVVNDYPQRFAAVVDVAGSPIEQPWIEAGRAKSVPLWLVHGEEDDEASFTEAKTMAEHYRQAGGNVQFTTVPGKGHGITEIFERPYLYEWLLNRQLGTDVPVSQEPQDSELLLRSEASANEDASWLRLQTMARENPTPDRPIEDPIPPGFVLL